MDNSRYQFYPFTVYTYDKVDSTNALAKRAIAMKGMGMDMSVHVAGEQTAGRGRNDRIWLNTKDAVMMSIVQSTKLGINKMPILNLVAAVAVRNAMMRLTGNRVELTVKWPNDVLTSDRLEKVCGILSEAVRIDDKKYAVIGIGVNLNASSMPDDLLQPATSIYLQYGKYIPVLDAVNEILREYMVQYKLMMNDTDAFLKHFSAGCISLGRHVAVDDGERVRYGVGEKLAPNGQLIVNFEDGESDVIYAADVSVRNKTAVDEKLAKKLLPKRSRNANKGAFGRAAMIVGSDNMPGAALMSVKACVRTGAGLTKALVTPEVKPAFAAIPEAMLVSSDDEADKLIEWATAIGIGCGMGVNERTRALTEAVLRSKKPCVIDADALNMIAAYPEIKELLHDKAVITPHPGEMSRLTGTTTEEVVKNFSPTAIEFAAKHGCTVLLKSASSIIVSPDGTVRYNDSGNDGLAKGGSGDVLTGIITALLAQGAKPFDAASLGSYLLGASAERALDLLRTRALCAGDVIDAISEELK